MSCFSVTNLFRKFLDGYIFIFISTPAFDSTWNLFNSDTDSIITVCDTIHDLSQKISVHFLKLRVDYFTIKVYPAVLLLHHKSFQFQNDTQSITKNFSLFFQVTNRITPLPKCTRLHYHGITKHFPSFEWRRYLVMAWPPELLGSLLIAVGEGVVVWVVEQRLVAAPWHFPWHICEESVGHKLFPLRMVVGTVADIGHGHADWHASENEDLLPFDGFF